MKSLKLKIRSRLKGILPGHVPDFLIVGAQKSATTSLHFMLGQHPRLSGSRPKEVCYFDTDENFEKGLGWYRRNFVTLKTPWASSLFFEATPAYLYREVAAGRIQSFNPAIKIVIALRNPVQRAYSAWNMYHYFSQRGHLPPAIRKPYHRKEENNILREFYQRETFPTFEEAVEADIRKFETGSLLEEPSIVRRGIYYHQVKRYLDLFGTGNVLVLGFRDITGPGKNETLNRILDFVGLPPSDWSFLKDEPRNARAYEPMPAHVAARLKTFYEPFDQQLFQLIGFKPNW